MLVAFPVGIYAAARRGRPGDTLAMGSRRSASRCRISGSRCFWCWFSPSTCGFLPAGGFPGWGNPLAALKALLLPAIALALPQAAILARVLRSALVETLGAGLYPHRPRQGLKCGAGADPPRAAQCADPGADHSGDPVSFLLAGAIIIENVFYLPGLGRMIFQAITQRDLIVVQGAVLVLVAAVILVTFLVDLGYALIDPRLRK